MNIVWNNLDNNTSRRKVRISVDVDGVRVAWRVRPADKKGPAFTGWICQEHYKDECEHVQAIEAALPNNVVDRLVDIEEQFNTKEEA